MITYCEGVFPPHFLLSCRPFLQREQFVSFAGSEFSEIFIYSDTFLKAHRWDYVHSVLHLVSSSLRVSLAGVSLSACTNPPHFP